jgi:hypothetical protein
MYQKSNFLKNSSDLGCQVRIRHTFLPIWKSSEGALNIGFFVDLGKHTKIRHTFVPLCLKRRVYLCWPDITYKNRFTFCIALFVLTSDTFDILSCVKRVLIGFFMWGSVVKVSLGEMLFASDTFKSLIGLAFEGSI